MRRLAVVLAVVSAACTGTVSGPTTTAISEPNGGTVAEPAVPTTPTGADIGANGQCWSSVPAAGTEAISFSDQTTALGLVDPLTGMHAHAAAWGDVNGDGLPDLVAGTFANRPIDRYQVRGATGPSPDRLLLGTPEGSFAAVAGFSTELGRTSGAVIVDLDNDGDDDIVLARNMRNRERADAPSRVYRNDGDTFTALDLPLDGFVSARSIGVLDHNQDGLLDLLIVEDRFSGAHSTRLLENMGNLVFADVTLAAGIPDNVHGLGVATSDVNGDGHTDFFIGGSNRFFVSSPDGYLELDEAIFQWAEYGDEDDPAGAAIADVNRDGWPDLIVGHHYNSTLSQGRSVPVRLYLHQGLDSATALPAFVDVTAEVGLTGLPTKAPHVEVVDFDNDGWPDILTTASAEGGTTAAVFRNLGAGPDGLPRFEAPSGLGSAQYWVAGPTADVDRDGRVDVLLVEWEPTLPSVFLHNETASGNWLEVSIAPEAGSVVIGTVVSVFESGRLGATEALLGVREVVASVGYTAGVLPWVHFGLGDADAVDVRVSLPDGSTVELVGVFANRHVRIPDCF